MKLTEIQFLPAMEHMQKGKAIQFLGRLHMQKAMATLHREPIHMLRVEAPRLSILLSIQRECGTNHIREVLLQTKLHTPWVWELHHHKEGMPMR